MPTVYIETSIVSYLRQKPSLQVVMAARQLLTHEWWNHERQNHELVTSQLVIDEASKGDRALADERLLLLTDIPLLRRDPQVDQIAAQILSHAVLPKKAVVDALHIAMTAHHGVEYLLTWNCKHIANPRIVPRIRDVLANLGCSIPIICTPEEMLYDDSDNHDS